MTLDEALQALHCPTNTDWAAVQRQYDERYNELQRLRETATTREERDAYAVRLHTVEEAYTFLKALPGFGPVTALEPELSPELQQVLRSPYADMRMGAVRTLGHLLHEDTDLAPLARQTLEGLVQDGSPEVAQAAQEALQGPVRARREERRPGLGTTVWGAIGLTSLSWGLLVALGLQIYGVPGYVVWGLALGEMLSGLAGGGALWLAHRSPCAPPVVLGSAGAVVVLAIGRALSEGLGTGLFLVSGGGELG